MTPQQIELALETIALVLEDLKKTQEKQQATIAAIKETLAEHAMRETQRTEQEPVAWQFMNGSSFRKRRPDDFADLDSDGLPYWKPLYTSPPQRTWVGLEKKDMPDGADPLFDDPKFIAGMVCAANKLMEKNCG